MKIVIGLVGEKGGGKETFVKSLKEIVPQVTHIRFSDLLLDIAAQLGIPKEKVERWQLQELAKELDRIFGKGTITRGIKAKLQKIDDGIIMLDGIRWQTDVEMLRSLPANLLVYITADVCLRYQRTKERKEKAGEATASFEQFLEEERAETEKYIFRIGTTADFVIQNDRGLEEFSKQVKTVYEIFLKYEKSA